MKYDLLVIGGGAAGFYGAIHAARQKPGLRIAVLEKGREFLSKVRISGGGRCNLTHRPMPPRELVQNYPRGHRELIGPFHVHASQDVIDFFNGLGMPTKIEADGRVFPQSDQSESVISHLMEEARRLGIQLHPSTGVKGFFPLPEGQGWQVETANAIWESDKLLVATGSSTRVWSQLAALGHTLVRPVPSLFTFHISDPILKGLEGLSQEARVEVCPPPDTATPRTGANFRKALKGGMLVTEGPVLITHWGLSGPAILKLSAWGARLFAGADYQFKIRINWAPEYHPGALPEYLMRVRKADVRKAVTSSRPFAMPARLWNALVTASGIAPGTRWQEVGRTTIQKLAAQVSHCHFDVTGKSTFKEEFVTAGGVALKEVDFKTFESRKQPGLYLAGEVLDIDAVTGGFNFQNAWTGGYIAGRAIAGGA